MPATTELIIRWNRKTVKHQPKKRNNQTEALPKWEWNIWHTEVAGTHFRFNWMPTNALDLSPGSERIPPDQSPGCWTLYSDFGTEPVTEFMATLIGTRTQEEARRLADKYVNRYARQYQDKLRACIEAIDDHNKNAQPQLF